MPQRSGEVFALPYSANSHLHHNNPNINNNHPTHKAQPRAGLMNDPHHGMPPPEDPKHRKKKDIIIRPNQPVIRDELTRMYSEHNAQLFTAAHQLATNPTGNPQFTLRLYPLSLERSALLAQVEYEEAYALENVRMAYDEERQRVEEEWKRGRERVREKLLEGVEERRRRAREEKEGEGITDAVMDQARTHVTRKTRNKMGGSPPPVAAPATNGPPNTNSLQVEEIPSPFPLPLTAVSAPTTGPGSKRKAKGGGLTVQAVGGLGKSIAFLTTAKEGEVDSDLGEIRRGLRRRRAAAPAIGSARDA